MFIIYINDLGAEIGGDVSKFGDDNKTGRVFEFHQDAVFSRMNETFYDWAEKWQMEFNVGKCCVLSAGRNNLTHDY